MKVSGGMCSQTRYYLFKWEPFETRMQRIVELPVSVVGSIVPPTLISCSALAVKVSYTAEREVEKPRRRSRMCFILFESVIFM